MNISSVRAGLANAADAISGLNCVTYAPDSIPEPCFYPDGVDIEFDQSFGRGMDEVMVVCRVLVSRSDDKSSQALLDGYLAGSGATSVKAAIEADCTLGGACADLRVQRVEGYRWYLIGPTYYLGAAFVVQVIGSGT